MNAIVLPQQIDAAELGPYCDTCGDQPCINPSFCATCQRADRQMAAFGAWQNQLSLEDEVQLLAERARDLAVDWACGLIKKPEAVDRAFNFALALGLHYRLAGTIEAICGGDPRAVVRALYAMKEQKPIDAIQRVIAAAFTPFAGTT